MAKRVVQLKTGSHLPLRVLATFQYESERGARRQEALYHALFREERLEGEWFEWCDAFVDLIGGLLQIEKTFGPDGAALDVRFQIVRAAGTGRIHFRPGNDRVGVIDHPDQRIEVGLPLSNETP